MSVTECSEYSVVSVLFRHNLMFVSGNLRENTQNDREPILQWVKDTSSLSCVQLLVYLLNNRLINLIVIE